MNNRDKILENALKKYEELIASKTSNINKSVRTVKASECSTVNKCKEAGITIHHITNRLGAILPSGMSGSRFTNICEKRKADIEEFKLNNEQKFLKI